MSVASTYDPGQWRTWLTASALPLWAEHGVDRRSGGFYEKLDFSLNGVEEPRRARLVARQIYCFASGHALGWTSPARELVRHGLAFLEERLIEPDGTVILSVDVMTGEARRQYDPYDYAFVLFALAAAARDLGDADRLHALALQVRRRLVAGWSHPQIGFEESVPRSLPLKSNPHMHLFEAFLAWAELMGDSEPSWQAHADRMAELALTRLIDRETGALYEFFNGDWQPLADAKGLLVEPGHQFEWSWLLARWSRRTGHAAAFAAAVRLAEIGEAHGIDPVRAVAINGLDETFRVRDADAKLWPQTERFKAWHELSANPLSSPALRNKAERLLPLASAGLRSFLTERPAGLWREVMRPDGSFVEEPVRASSFYHIVCAIRTINADALAAEAAS